MGIIAGSISGVRVSNSSATILALLLFSVDIKKNPEVMQYLSHCFGKMGLPAVIRGSWTFTYNSGRKSILNLAMTQGSIATSWELLPLGSSKGQQ